MALISFTKDNLNQAVDLASRAIEIAPDYGLAYGVRAFALGYRAYTQWGSDWYEDAKQASIDIKRATSLQSDEATTLFLVGGASWFMARARTGIGFLERAVKLNPNLAMAHGLLGLGYASIDRPAEGLVHVALAGRLSPRDPMAHFFSAAEALCKFAAGDFSGAILSAETGLRINTDSSDNHLYMAAALAELGKTEQAKKQIERALRIVPKLTLAVIARGIPDGTAWERYHAALRKAGLPE